MAVSMEHLLYVLFTAISFFTFLKFLSGRLYLYQHRMLPVIAGIITVFDFYIIAIPLTDKIDGVGMLRVLANMSSTVVMFMMFFYMLEIMQPRHYKVVRVIVLTIMIVVCLAQFVVYRIDWPGYSLDAIAGLTILFGCLYNIKCKKETGRFDKEDEAISQIMMFTFVLSVVAYVVQSVLLPGNYMVTAIAFAIDCVLYYDIAQNNRIEDTEAILKGTIFDLMEEPVLLFNRKFVLIDMNSASDAAFPTVEGLEFAFEDGDINKKCTLVEKLINREEAYRDLYVGEDWYKLHVTEVKDMGEVRGYIVTAADITDKYRQVAEARTETKEKSQFLAQMSHELRSPLHAVIGLSDILLGKHDISNKNRGLVRHIKNSSDRLLDLVDAILDYSKLESGKFTFAESKYSVDKLLTELAYDNIINLGNKDVDMTISVNTEFPRHLYGDSVRVREILQNLIGNAIKFTEHGSVMAELSFFKEETRYKIEFSIKDTGIGMSPDQIRTVFSEYVSYSDDTFNEGTGLGLSIAKQIIDLLGGQIKAESDGITGSVISGFFYQARTGAEMRPPKLYNKHSVIHQEVAFSPEMIPDWICPGAKILVADDMKINQEIFAQLLAPWKCQVDLVSDGTEAVNMAKYNDYQLIFLDHMMVKCSGFEAAEQIRKFNEEVPVVLVTANTADSVRQSITEYGVTDFLGKPVRGQELQAILDKYIAAAYREKDYHRPASRRHRREAMVAYRKTLEIFVKEMGPLLMQLPRYKTDNRELFRIKVHGIKGVSRQIGRESFADKAEIMEMAAKSEHWDYVDKHFEEFTAALCETIEDVTEELTQLAPDLDPTLSMLDEFATDDVTPDKIREIFEELQRAFDAYDITKIENGIKALDTVELDKEESRVYSKLIDAYDNLEYEDGSNALKEYFNNDQSAI